MALTRLYEMFAEKHLIQKWRKVFLLLLLSLFVLTSLWVLNPTSLSCNSARESGSGNTASEETPTASGELVKGNQTMEERVEDPNFFASMYRDPALHRTLKDECMARNDLQVILRGASMADGTIILTLYTEGYSLLSDLFFARMRVGEDTFQFLKHMVVVTFTNYEKLSCCQRHLHCYVDSQDDLTVEFKSSVGTEFYQSKEYISITWRKILLKAIVVQMGYNVIFTDSDVMWLRNPLPHFASDHDLITGCDHKGCGVANTGFYFVRSNNKTIALYKSWLDVKNKCNGCNDQQGLQGILPALRSNIGLKTLHIETHIIGGLCQYPEDFSELVTFHSICCIGFNNKYMELSKFLAQYDWYKVVSSH